MFRTNTIRRLFFSTQLILCLSANATFAIPSTCEPALRLSSQELIANGIEGVAAARIDLVLDTDSAGVLMLQSADSGLQLDDGPCGNRSQLKVIEKTTKRLVLAFSEAGEHGFTVTRANAQAGWTSARFFPAEVREQTFDLPTAQGFIEVSEKALFATTQSGAPSLLAGPPGSGKHMVSLFELTDLSGESSLQASLSMVARSRAVETREGTWLASRLSLRVEQSAHNPGGIVQGSTVTPKEFPEVDPDPEGIVQASTVTPKEFPEVDPDPEGLCFGQGSCHGTQEVELELWSLAQNDDLPQRQALLLVSEILWPQLALPANSGNAGIRLHSLN